MIFYKPTGPLSGVTTCAIACVAGLLGDSRTGAGADDGGAERLRGRADPAWLSLLLTFPPIADLF